LDPDPTVLKGQNEYLLKLISEKKKLLKFTPLTSHEFKALGKGPTHHPVFSHKIFLLLFQRMNLRPELKFVKAATISIYLTVSGGGGGLASPSGVPCPQFCTSGIQK
jgi:hypothetical protein